MYNGAEGHRNEISLLRICCMLAALRLWSVPTVVVHKLIAASMYVHELSIDLAASKIDRESLYDKATWLYSALYKNGQVQEYDNAIYFNGKQLVMVLTSIEKHSLSKKHGNVYVRKNRDSIEKICGSKIKTKLLGRQPPYDREHLCRCVKPKSFYLQCSELNFGSPLSCGDCGKNVPIYRIPRSSDNFAEKEYASLCSWDRSYKACYRLESLCGFGERWATRQMQEHDSGLSKEGRAVCKDISKHTGVPVYYFLFNYRALTIEQDQSRKCPGCGREWHLDEPWHRFNFKCDDCLLISEWTTNSSRKINVPVVPSRLATITPHEDQ